MVKKRKAEAGAAADAVKYARGERGGGMNHMSASAGELDCIFYQIPFGCMKRARIFLFEFPPKILNCVSSCRFLFHAFNWFISMFFSVRREKLPRM